MSLITYYTSQQVDTNVNSFTSSYTSKVTKSTQITRDQGTTVETEKTSIIEKETHEATYVPHPFFYTRHTSRENETRFTFAGNDVPNTTYTGSEFFSENESISSHEGKAGEFLDQFNDKTILEQSNLPDPLTYNVVSSVDYTGTLQSLTTLNISPEKIYTTREIPRVQIVDGEEITRNEVHITTKEGVAGNPNGSIWTLSNGSESIEDATHDIIREEDEDGVVRIRRTFYDATYTAIGSKVSQTDEFTIAGSNEFVLVYRNCPTRAGGKTLYDSVWIWTKLTTDESYTATWHDRKNENPPTEFSLLGENAYSVTEPLPISSVDASSKTIENSFSVEYESQKETKKNYAFQTGERAQTNNPVDINYDDGENLAEFEAEGNQETQDTKQEAQSITGVWVFARHFDMFTEDAKLMTITREGYETTTSTNGRIIEQFTALDADGGYIVVDETKDWHSTLTINYSTLIPQYSPWASSNSGFTPDTQDPLGGPIFRDEGQTISVAEIEDTIREGREEQVKTGKDDTDYITEYTEELTSGRLAYESQIGDTTCEGNPYLNKIVGTTKTAILGLPLAVSNKFRIVQTDKAVQYLQPIAVPTTFTISDEEVEETILSYTATRSISPEERLDLPPNIVGYESTVLEPEREDRSPTTTRTEITSAQSLFYARLVGTSKNDQPDFISASMGNDVLKLHYNDTATYQLTLYGQPFLGAFSFESEFANTNSETGQEFFQSEENSVDGRRETKSYGSDSENTQNNLTSKHGKVEERSTFVRYENFHQQLKVYFNSLMIHTKMSGKGGFVYTDNLSGNSSGWQSYETFSNVSAYKGIADTDFERFENGVLLTTQYMTFDSANWTYYGFDQKVIRSVEETREETYSEATTGTIRLSDELQNIFDTFGEPPNYDGDNGQYVEVILSDACGNTTQYGMDSVDGEPPDSGGDGDPFYDDIYGDDYDGGGGGFGYDYGNAYDEYGNYIDPYADGGTPFTPDDGGGGGDDYYGDPVDPVDDRDPSCGEFTFTYNDTTHLPHMTRKITVTEGEIFEITPEEQFPYFYQPLAFYGNKEMLTLNSYDDLPQRNWFHEANSDGEVFNFRYWTFYNENRFQQEKNNLFDLIQSYPFGGIGFHAPFNEGRDQVAGQIVGGFNSDEYQSIGGEPQGFEMFNQGYAHTAFCQTAYSHLDSVRLVQRIDNFQYPNTIFEPFYKVTNIGFSNARTITDATDDFGIGAYLTTSGYRDFRRNNMMLIRRTKKFTEGAWGYIVGDSSKTTNSHIRLEEDASLQDHFSYDSDFYKEFLEQTSYTLTSSKNSQSEDWYYKSASRSVSELVAGLDGKYQPVYESGTSGTFPFEAIFEEAGDDCETHLSGSFYGFNYKQINDGAITIRAKYNGGHCCPCHQTAENDTRQWYDWGMLSQLENVIINGNDNMSVAINPCATMWTQNQNVLVPIPITTATKDLEEGGEWVKGTYSATDMLVIDLYRKAFSCEVPKMLILGQWGVGDGATGKYFIPPFIYSKPNEELNISQARGHFEFTSVDPFNNRHTCNQGGRRDRGLELAKKLDIFKTQNLNPNH